MRIVIDLQGAQSSGSRHRGIGRYSLALAQGIVQERGEHEIMIALNGLFADSVEPIRAAFEGLLPQGKIVVWNVPGPVAAVDSANAHRRHVAERIREAFLASLRPDMVLVTSLFEGSGDNAITSVGMQTALPTAVVLYDLIPLIYRDIYFAHPAIEPWYLEKLEHLRRANLLLSISASSGREAIDLLGFATEKVINISTACNNHFQPLAVTEDLRRQIRDAYGITRPFVMYTGGIDHRKNIDGLIRAYASLPRTLREAYQLAVVCAVPTAEKERLEKLAYKAGLTPDDFILTGFVSEDDLVLLYNACTLFVFPSWHEGFGLPALEAMRCGKAVIAGNTSSLPEVIGREDALFDPRNDTSITAKMEEALVNEAFRESLERHGLEQSVQFSWLNSARRAVAAMEAVHAARKATALISEPQLPKKKPRLAYLSPLPPERSGISDYSAELIPELSRWYEVEVIVDQLQVSDRWIQANCAVRTVAWFRDHATQYDRVIYHVGNSHFHQHMFALMEEIPGVVILHDFFLSGIQAQRDNFGLAPHAWAQALQSAHGYIALHDRYTAVDAREVIWSYPVNLAVLQSAQGIIVHSNYSCMLAAQWYGIGSAASWAVIPLLRTQAEGVDRELARQALGLAPDDVLTCSFGLLGPHKLNLRILKAWLASPLASDQRAYLIFVGENDGGDYGEQILATIKESGLQARIRITGWTDTDTFRRYLTAADIGVQLRTLTRGETSAAVLDCMNYGLATVVNAHGSMADLDPSGVWMLPDAFSDAELIDALITLRHDQSRRDALGTRGREIIHSRHAPQACALQYANAIENFHCGSATGLQGLLQDIAGVPPEENEIVPLAGALAKNFPPVPRRRQLLVDVSELMQRDAKNFAQGMTQAVLQAWLQQPPQGWQVEPVFATPDSSGYRYARRFTSRLLGIPEYWADDAPAEAWPGDVFFGLDQSLHVIPSQQMFLQEWRNRGIKVSFLVHDSLPVHLPPALIESAHAKQQRWLETISQFDALLCISQSVAEEMKEWLSVFGPKRERPLVVDWCGLEADINSNAPSAGLPGDAKQTLTRLTSRPSFLMMGAIGPHERHAQALACFDLLWARGQDINLVVVGKQDCMNEPLGEQLIVHPEHGRRLFWLEGISDGYFEKIYGAATCLVVVSEEDGSCLPPIGIMQHRLPIIARDAPALREVAGSQATYFSGEKPEDLERAITDWLEKHGHGTAPSSIGMPWLQWKQSALLLLDAVLCPAHSSPISSN